MHNTVAMIFEMIFATRMIKFRIFLAEILQLESMEIELKIRIFNAQNFQKVISLLKSLSNSTLKANLVQQNVFIDTKTLDLNAQRINFRLRKSVSRDGTTCYLTMKGKNTAGKHINNGILCVNELEQKITQSDFNEMCNDPNLIPNYEYDLVKELLDSTKSREFQKVGEFTNNRTVFDYDNLTLECDETTYEFGTAYEIEVEHAEPELAKQKL